MIAIERRVQPNEPAFLEAVSVGQRSFVLQVLLPSQDRLALATWNGKAQRLEGVMRSQIGVPGCARGAAAPRASQAS